MKITRRTFLPLLLLPLVVAAAPAEKKIQQVQSLMARAYRYYAGKGKPLDYAQALQLYRQAALLGDTEAQFIVGGMYYRGLGCEPDRREAFKWLLRAAEQGRFSPQSLTIIGTMYLHGDQVPVNYAQARRWLHQAAALGVAEAQKNLAFLFYNGLGGRQDYAKALELYRQAALQGDNQAQNSVGLMYGSGLGTDADPVQAYAWFSLAASQGNVAARLNRNNLLASMDWEALNKAQALSVALYKQVEKNKEQAGN